MPMTTQDTADHVESIQVIQCYAKAVDERFERPPASIPLGEQGSVAERLRASLADR
jgi:hypothetical protein